MDYYISVDRRRAIESLNAAINNASVVHVVWVDAAIV